MIYNFLNIYYTMDILEKVMTQIYENKADYKEGDYIQLCNELKDCYNKIKGIPVKLDEGKGDASASEAGDDDEIILEFSWGEGYSDQYLPSYSADYIEPY